jgi:hypothetical protein
MFPLFFNSEIAANQYRGDVDKCALYGMLNQNAYRKLLDIARKLAYVRIA